MSARPNKPTSPYQVSRFAPAGRVGRRGPANPTMFCPNKDGNGDTCGERLQVVGAYPDDYEAVCHVCGYHYIPGKPKLGHAWFPRMEDPHREHRRTRPVMNIACGRCREAVLQKMETATGANADHQRRAAERFRARGK